MLMDGDIGAREERRPAFERLRTSGVMAPLSKGGAEGPRAQSFMARQVLIPKVIFKE
jgi:hypothetical protein